MKRKITQIGRFFAMAALMLGATSWASAQEAPSEPQIGKIYKEVKVWDLTDWNADTLLIKAENPKEEYWKRTISGGVRFTYVNTSQDELRNANGEMLASKDGTVLPAMAGLTWVSDEGNKKPWNATLRAKMDGDDNMLQCGRQAQIGFVQEEGYPKVGQIIVLNISALGTGNAGRGIDLNKSKGVKPLFSTEQKDSLWCGTSTESSRSLVFEVTDASALKFYTIKGIGVRKISILEKLSEPDTVHVAYLGNADKAWEPAYTALEKISKVQGNKVKIDYLNVTEKLTAPKLSDFEGYDVLVMGGSGNPAGLPAVATDIIGSIPVVSTHAFWYGSGRLNWASANGANNNGVASNYVDPQISYKKHPIFAGVVDTTNFNPERINIFNLSEGAANNGRYMQGYPDAKMTAGAPAHTVLATSALGTADANGNLKSIAEVWRFMKSPYVLVAYDYLNKPTESMTEDGERVIVNAVNYAANALAPFQPSNLGTCVDPKITFEKVNAQGTTDSDTMRYVVKIEVEDVTDANNASGDKIHPTVMITIGSDAKEYDFDHPDTIWESCTVKAKATALLYNDSKEVSATFEANLREMPAPVFKAEKVGDKYKVSFETYETTIDNKVTQPTIRYSLDGGAEVVYDPAEDSILPNVTAIVRAQASLMYYKQSETSDTVWNNPDKELTHDPTISHTNKAGLFTITIRGDEGKIYYTLDGSDPRTSSTKEEYNYAIDWEVFDDPVTVKAYALADDKGYSNVVEETLTNENPITLSTPTFTIEGGSFTIASVTDGVEVGDYAIYYTTNGIDPDPKSLNGLIYTDKVTFKGGDKFKVKAIAIGKGYKPSVVATSEDVTPTGEVTEFGIRHYYSTFGLDDPTTVLKEKINPSEPDVYTDGWFRWTKNADGNCNLDDEVRDMYLTEQEKADGITYGNSEKDDKAKARLFIFQQNDAKDGAWRHFNRWIFWKDGGNRRVIVQENYVVNGIEGATGSGIRFFQATPKATAGPVQKFKGPFAVVINIGAGENFWNNKDRSAKMDVCLSNESDTGNEMILASVSCGNGQMGTDTIRYYGDEEVCVRLTTVSDNVILFDFKVFSEGTPLAELACTGIDPEAGTTADDAKEVQRGLEKITITFNNPVTVTNGATMMVPLVDGQPTPESPDAITASIAQGGENEAVITLSKPVAAADGTKYVINLPAVAKDAADHTNDVISMYYVVKGGAAAIDEVSAAKEVVATYIYSISGAQMNTLAPGVNIVKKVYNDGTTTTEKVQVK